MPSRVRPAGSRGLLVACASWREAQQLARELRARPLDGQENVVQGEASVLVEFADAASAAAARTWLPGWTPGPAAAGEPRQVRIEVIYDGPDLDVVGELTGLGRSGVAHLHAQTEWTVAFVGFAPGFAYLVAPHGRLRVARRTEPRTRVPAGSVALGGAYAAVYPRQSPGGWQLIGHSPTVMWDVRRDPPATLAPGDQVRFAPVRETVTVTAPAADEAAAGAPAAPAGSGPSLVVEQPGFLATVQDDGRPGLGHLGIGRAGALDPGALATANWLVGNANGAAGIEVAPGGFRVRATEDVILAVTGARTALTIDRPGAEAGAAAGPRPAPFHTPFLLRAGQRLSFGPPDAGIRCYLAVRGGVAVAPVLGSRSTDTLAALGPPNLRAGTVLPVGPEPVGEVWYSPDPPADHGGPVDPRPAGAEQATLPGIGRPPSTVLSLTAGPGHDEFPAGALDRLLTSTWTVGTAADRVGLRLTGSAGPLPVRDAGGLPSEGMVTGSVQVPPSGEPILFLNDHPVTGGYPVIAVVEADALPAAAQLAPGDQVAFALAGRTPDTTAGGPTSGVPAA